MPRTWILLKDSLNFLLEGVPEGIDLCLESGPIGSKFLHPTSPTQIPLAENYSYRDDLCQSNFMSIVFSIGG